MGWLKNLFKKKEGGTVTGNIIRGLLSQPKAEGGTLQHDEYNPLSETESSNLVENPTFWGQLKDSIFGILASAKGAVDNGITVNAKADSSQINKIFIYVLVIIGLIFIFPVLRRKLKT